MCISNKPKSYEGLRIIRKYIILFITSFEL